MIFPCGRKTASTGGLIPKDRPDISSGCLPVGDVYRMLQCANGGGLSQKYQTGSPIPCASLLTPEDRIRFESSGEAVFMAGARLQKPATGGAPI